MTGNKKIMLVLTAILCLLMPTVHAQQTTIADTAVHSQDLVGAALAYFQEGNPVIANEYVYQAMQRDNFAQYADWLGRKLMQDSLYDAALTVLASGYEVSVAARQSTDPELNNSNNAKSLFTLAMNYSKLLEQKGDYATLASVLAYFIEQPHAGTTGNALKLGNAYLKQGKKADALLAWDRYLRMPHIQGRDEEVIAALAPLYRELNGPNANFDAYIDGILAAVDNVLTAEFETEMIKRKAPAFSLTDRNGKTVSLADLKGKIVVLEFWATWCSPCRRSLPGMQAVANKYGDDSEVVFLFVDVFQKEPNYKELVEKYLADHGYTFHVVFDKMDDPSQSMARAYGVNGIPHKVIIDREGFIRFEGTGDLAHLEKTVNELSAKIELVRKTNP